jgi:AcrR family transcriptional regulator
MRADALRNRDQIVGAARVLFVTQGPDTPMEEIARAAGVGVGTLYRRFPDRGSLINAVSADIFERLATIIRTARDEEPTPWLALRRYLSEWVGVRLGMLYDTMCGGLPEALRVDPELRRVRETWLELFEQLVRDAQQSGELRPDVEMMDVALLMNMLIKADLPAETGRLLELMLDGLRAQPSGLL